MCGWVREIQSQLTDGMCVIKASVSDAPTQWSPALLLEICSPASLRCVSNLTHLIVTIRYQEARAHQGLDKELIMDGKASVNVFFLSDSIKGLTYYQFSVLFSYVELGNSHFCVNKITDFVPV